MNGPERQPIVENPPHYDTEGKKVFEEVLLSVSGLSVEDWRALPADEKRGLSVKVKEMFRDPEVQEILQGRTEGGLTAEDANAIRSVIGSEKWNSLSEAVSYVRTLVGTLPPEERIQKYEQHLALGVDANELKHTLSNLHDVWPSRIDTDIKHQSTLFYRAVVELVSNARDASIEHKSPIGRFGIGFYQIFNHLNDPEDRMVITTKSADSQHGTRIEFRNSDGDIDFKITEDSSITEHGTTIEVKSKEFEAEKGQGIINEFFSHTQDASIQVNGESLDQWTPDNKEDSAVNTPTVHVETEDGRLIVKDAGVGMDPRVVFEKLLVPKLSEKPPVYELREEEVSSARLFYESGEVAGEKNHQCEVVFQVGDIKIESVFVTGYNIAKTVVIDLPPSTNLGEQRDQVDVDAHTIGAIKGVVDQALALPTHDRFKVVNALGKAVRTLQNRSTEYASEHNAYTYLQKQLRDAFPEMSFLPNQESYTELDLDESTTALLDPKIYQTAPRGVPGFTAVNGWVSRRNIDLLEAKFKEGSEAGVITADNYMLIDQDARPSEHPELTERVAELSMKYGAGEMVADEGSVERKKREKWSYSNPEELVEDRWGELYFGSPEIGLRQIQRLKAENPQLVSSFERVLTVAPAGSVVELWRMLEYYVNEDPRNEDVKLEEINALTENMEALLANPIVREAAHNNAIPIFSMFESPRNSLPGHINNEWRNIKGVREVNGKTYFVFESDSYRDDQWRKLLSEDGETVWMPGREGVKFQDKNITVYEDKIVDTQTGETISLPLPNMQQWGEVSFGFNNKLSGEFLKVDAETGEVQVKKDTSEEVQEIEENESFVEDRNGDRYQVQGGALYVNGERHQLLEHIGVPIRDVILTQEGEVLVVAHSQNEDGLLDDGEQYVVLDSHGQMLWKFDPETWGEKFTEDKSYSYDARDIERLPRIVPVEHGKTISPEDPIAKIVTYRLIGSGRGRQILGYINGRGEEVRIGETGAVNTVTLAAKHVWEANCGCCDVSDPFSCGRFSPKEAKDPVEGFTELPFEITGEFKFNSGTNEWEAPARRKASDYNKNVDVIAIFDTDGNFVREEVLGSSQTERSNYQNVGDYYNERARSMQLRLGGNGSHDFTTTTKLHGTGGYDSSLRMIERDVLKDGLLSAGEARLQPEHSEVLGDFLSQYPVPNGPKLERLFYRVYQSRHLAPEDMQMFLGSFYETTDLNVDVLTAPEVVGELRKVSYLDQERFGQLLELLDGSLLDGSENLGDTTTRVVKFYAERLQSAPTADASGIINNLQRTHQYSNAVTCDGFTLVRHGTSVPAHEVPRRIRPFVTFLQRRDDELAQMTTETAPFMPEGESRQTSLSEIIQWKRLNEGDARSFTGNVEELSSNVAQVTEGTTREHIVREITHAIHFQALNSTDLYLRELVQNAVDIIATEGVEEGAQEIKVSVETDGERELTTHFTDPVGMDINTFINFFLVPGESTKRDGKSIGFYGQGVYTLFKDAEKVNIKTSRGDGMTWYFSMTPVVENDMIVDVSMDIQSSEEEFKGTTISKVQQKDHPFVEAAYVRDSLMSLVSALDSNRGVVNLQGEQINASYDELFKTEYEDGGELRVYKNPNNIVTQNGLYVKELGSEYSGLVPGFMNKSLKEWGGIVVDLPSSIALTRSRQDIASKEKVVEKLNPMIQQGLAYAYLGEFGKRVQENARTFPLKELPYDYFGDERYRAPAKYQQDAHALLEGQPLSYLDEYGVEDNAVKLMTTLPVFNAGDRKMSLEEIRDALLHDAYPFNQDNWRDMLDCTLVNLIEEKQRDVEQMRAAEKRAEEGIKMGEVPLDRLADAAPEDIREWLQESESELKELDTLSRAFLETISPVFGRGQNITPEYYYSEDDSVARARRGVPVVGWNLYKMHKGGWQSPLRSIEQYKEEMAKTYDRNERDAKGYLLDAIGTIAHEVAHTTENHSGWTHNDSHEQEQARVLVQSMIQGGLEPVLKILGQ